MRIGVALLAVLDITGMRIGVALLAGIRHNTATQENRSAREACALLNKNLVNLNRHIKNFSGSLS